MRSLRYWLGLPLYNLILWIVFIVMYLTVLQRNDCGDATVLLIMAISTMTVPFVTALFYPAERPDCRPLWIPVAVSFAAIWLVASVTMTAILGFWDPLPDLFMGTVLAFVETVGFGVGLLVKDSARRDPDRSRGAAPEG